jgi:hypothetical protein
VCVRTHKARARLRERGGRRRSRITAVLATRIPSEVESQPPTRRRLQRTPRPRCATRRGDYAPGVGPKPRADPRAAQERTRASRTPMRAASATTAAPAPRSETSQRARRRTLSGTPLPIYASQISTASGPRFSVKRIDNRPHATRGGGGGGGGRGGTGRARCRAVGESSTPSSRASGESQAVAPSCSPWSPP